VLFAAGGNPYGVSVSEGPEDLSDDIKKAVSHQVKRTVMVAGYVKAGLSNS
jgi:NAD(P)H dehydrogenase (quinone)